MSRFDDEENARKIGSRERGIRGAVRRMAIKVTSRVLWQLAGHKLDATYQETVNAEVFSGVGFYARPRTSSRAEAILSRIGDAAHSVIVATRDEDLRKLWDSAAFGNPDVAAMFNSGVIVVCMPDGTVRLGAADAAGDVVVQAALDDFMAALDQAITTLGPAGSAQLAALQTALKALNAALGWKARTSKTKAT